MTPTLKAATAAIAVLGFAYLLGAFIAASWDIAAWDTDGRAAVALFGTTFAALVGGANLARGFQP